MIHIFSTKPLIHQSEHGLHKYMYTQKIDCYRRAIWLLLSKYRLKHTSSSAYKKKRQITPKGHSTYSAICGHLCNKR